MTSLARAEPGFSKLGPLTDGSTAQDSISVNRWNLEALSVNDKHIQPDSITTGMIVVGSVGTDELANNAVTSTKITNGAVVTDKLDALSVTGAKIAGTTITGDKISGLTITGDKIASNTIESGKLNITNVADISTLFAGSITISAASGGGEPSTGVYITASRFKMIQSSTVMVDMNPSSSYYYFKGEIHCTKITVESNASNSINVGADTTIGGNLSVNGEIAVRTGTTYDAKVSFDGYLGSRKVWYDYSANEVLLQNQVASSSKVRILGYNAEINAGSSQASISVTGSVAITASDDITISIGTGSLDHFALRRGTTEVLYFDGDDSDIYIANHLRLPASKAIYFGTNYLINIGSDIYWGATKLN